MEISPHAMLTSKTSKENGFCGRKERKTYTCYSINKSLNINKKIKNTLNPWYKHQSTQASFKVVKGNEHKCMRN